MLFDSNAAVTNLFSFYNFRDWLQDSKIDLFLKLHILDCGNAITCMYHNFDACASPYGHERCRLPTNGGCTLCAAFVPLYYLVDNPRICPELLEVGVTSFARHCLCAEHAEEANVHSLAARIFVAVQRWRCRQVFKEEPDGLPSTPIEERPGALKLSFRKVPNRSPSLRPNVQSRFSDDDEPEDDSWGLYKKPSRVSNRSTRVSNHFSLRRLSSSLSIYQPTSDPPPIPIPQPKSSDGQPSVRWSQFQQFKGRAKSVMGKIAKKTG